MNCSPAAPKRTVSTSVRETVKQNKGCGALITNEASGKKLDGTTSHVADFQLCGCN